MKLILITLLTGTVINGSDAFALHTRLSSTVAQRAFVNNRSDNNNNLIPATYGTLFASGNDDSAATTLQEPTVMRIMELKSELQSYGISTKAFLEKSELVDAVIKARAEGMKPLGSSSSTTASNTASTTTTTSNEPKNDLPREVRLQLELDNCGRMKVSELKEELKNLGISTRMYFEKSEFVRALAEARIDGVKPTEEEIMVAEVEVLGANDAGPKKRETTSQDKTANDSPFAGGSSFGGGASPFGTGGVGGMGGIADLLKNMEGGVPAGMPNMGDMVNGMGGGAGMPDMAKIQQLMSNPKVRSIMAKAQSNPKIMAAVTECMSNPAAFAKYQNDPEIKDLINEFKPLIM